MSNKRYQLLILWNQNFVEAMPAIKLSWRELIQLAKHVRRKWDQNTELYFLQWEEGDQKPTTLELGRFSKGTLEAEYET